MLRCRRVIDVVIVVIDANAGSFQGEYVTKNSEIKIHEELLMMGLYGNYWQFTLALTQRPDVALCLYIEGKVTKVKRSRKAKKKKERKGRS